MQTNPNTGATGTNKKANGGNGPTDESESLTAAARKIGANAGAAAGTATNLAHTAQEYGQKLSTAASQAKDFVGEKVAVVSEKIKELKDSDLGELAEDAKQFARRKPGQAILISAAVGLLLGLIIRGRR